MGSLAKAKPDYWLQAVGELRAAGIFQPSREVRLILAHLLGIDSADLYVNEEALPSQAPGGFREAILKRSQGCPLSRITGQRWFYKHSFSLNADVLDPRPDSESLIMLVLRYFATPPRHFLEIGVGSGCLALSLLSEWPEAKAVGVDISQAALAQAKANAVTMNIDGRLRLCQDNWLPPATAWPLGGFDLVISNPPYIRTDRIKDLEIAVKDYDPLLSLDGGEDGLRAYRAIAQGLSRQNSIVPVIAIEIGYDQKDAVIEIMQDHGYLYQDSEKDLGGHCRALLFTRQ